jgi:hypothetical protein
LGVGGGGLILFVLMPLAMSEGIRIMKYSCLTMASYEAP